MIKLIDILNEIKSVPGNTGLKYKYFNPTEKAYGILFLDNNDEDEIEDTPYIWNNEAIVDLVKSMGYTNPNTVAGEFTHYTSPGDEDEMLIFRTQENNPNLQPKDLTIGMYKSSIETNFPEKEDLNEIKIQPSNTGIKKPFYLFVDGDGRLELDREEFGKYILININKIKSLWNNQGGDWDNDNISQDEIDQAVSHVWASFPNLRFQPYFSKTIKDFSKEDENNLITHFLDSLQNEINLNEIKVKPNNTGVGGFWALIMTYIDECDVNVRIFRNQQEAKNAALEDNWELAYDNGDTELSKEEYVTTHSWEDPGIWYADIKYEIVKVK